MNGKPFTPEETEYLKKNYANMRTEDISTHLNMTNRKVYQKAFDLGLKKSAEFFKSDSSGRLNALMVKGYNYRFKKGQTPVNKGQKMPDEVYAICKKTMFKKGNVPANHKPVGSTRITVDGYTEVKTAEPRFWEQDHRLAWEFNFGPIPPKHKIVFIDGNTQNLHINNLAMKTYAEALEGNTIYRYPQELRILMRMHGKLKRQISKTKNHE